MSTRAKIRASVVTHLNLMPWERKAGLILIGFGASPWWMLVGPSMTIQESASVFVVFSLPLIFGGVILIVLHRPLGWLDYRISNFVPGAFSRGWGDSKQETAQAWWFYAGAMVASLGCLDLLSAFAVFITGLLLRLAAGL